MKGFLIFLFGVLGFELLAQAPKFSNDFLNIGIGARGMALSGAASASTESIQSAYWNPACLPYMKSAFQVSAQHAEWFAGIGSYDYLGFGKSLDDQGRTFGSLSLIRMAIDKIPNTLRLRAPDGSIDYSRIEEFSVADYALLISFGKKLKDEKWSLGANAKIIHRNFGSFANAWGVGIDVGLRFKANSFSFALMGRDITTTYNAYTFSFSEEEKAILLQTNNDIPKSSVEYTLPKVILATAYKFTTSSRISGLVELNLECSGNGLESSLLSSESFNIDPKIGLELNYKEQVFLRLGAGNFQRSASVSNPDVKEFSFYPTAGVGLKFGKIYIDYAMTNIGNTGIGLYSNFISLSLDL